MAGPAPQPSLLMGPTSITQFQLQSLSQQALTEPDPVLGAADTAVNNIVPQLSLAKDAQPPSVGL